MRNRIIVWRSFVDVLVRPYRILIKKLQRGTVSFEEMMRIAEVLDVGYEQAFVFPDGGKIKIGRK